jgi:hypothetical protein
VTGDLRDLLCQARVGKILDPRQRQRLRSQSQAQDRRIGRIDLAVDRRRRQIGRQERSRCIDRRLHFLFGHVEAQVEAELQRDDRRAGRTRRRHLVESRHLAELALERRGHRRGHDFGTRTRVQRRDLDRRIVDLGQRRQRQEPVCKDADEQDRRHQQRGCDRPQDEQA